METLCCENRRCSTCANYRPRYSYSQEWYEYAIKETRRYEEQLKKAGHIPKGWTGAREECIEIAKLIMKQNLHATGLNAPRIYQLIDSKERADYFLRIFRWMILMYSVCIDDGWCKE